MVRPWWSLGPSMVRRWRFRGAPMVLSLGVNGAFMVLQRKVACLRRLYTMLLWRSHGAAMILAYTPL